MMANSDAYIAVGAIIGGTVVIYVVFLILASIPFFQRHFVYAHKVHTLPWHNLDEPQYWGFAKNQVVPFSLKTCDGETLYAWHILPLSLYSQHEASLIESVEGGGFCSDITETENFRLLREDPDSKLVISLHGNAGHVVQGVRPTTYHALTDTSRYHVLAIDYRGFGRSTGSPTEKGLILDAVTTVNWAISVAGVPPERIVLLGHSIGTAVTAAVAEHFAKEGVDFAGVVLVAGFSSLPTMLSGYSIAGYVPILAPFRVSPWLLHHLMRFVVDKWLSADRLRDTVTMVKARNGTLNLHLVHAWNDRDIPYYEDDKLFAAAINGLTTERDPGISEEDLKAEKAARTVHRGNRSFTTTWKDEKITIRQELFPHGGHNDVLYYAPTLLAVARSFDTAP